MRERALDTIARLKLRELERQRDALVAAYDTVEARARAAGGARATLRALDEGLRGITIAGQAMHPDCVNLEGMLAAGSTAAIRRARDRLWTELERGRFRSRAAFAFGALLSEWTDRERTDDQANARIEAQVAKTAPAIDRAWFERLLARVEREPVAKTLRELAFGRAADAPIEAHRVARDPEKPAAIRAEAELFTDLTPSGDPNPRAKELADAIAILWTDAATWRWPDEVHLRSVWAGDRHRLHPDLDLMTTLFLDDVATALGPLAAHLHPTRANRLLRLTRLKELSAPEIIVQNEVRMLDESTRGLVPDPSLDAPKTHGRSLAVARRAEASSLAATGLELVGGYGYAGNALTRMTALVHAEVRVAELLDPEGALYVVKADFADWFPSLSHELVLALLEGLGLQAPWLELVRRYLAVPVAHGGEVHVAECGLPLGLPLSRLLSEVVLAFLDAAVRLAAPDVRIVRLVDDFVLLGRSRTSIEAAWEAVRDFTAAAGARLAEEKCGAVAIRGVVPRSFPSARPRFGLLELEDDGVLRPSQDGMNAHRARVLERVAGAKAILGKVEIYNEEMRALVSGLCATLPLSEGHHARVKRAVREFERALGVRDAIQAEVGKRYFGGAASLPDAWLHWPRTAGGLGMVDPGLELVQYRKAKRPEPPPALESDAVHASARLGGYYLALLDPIAPLAPAAHAATDALAADFAKRLGEVGGPKKMAKDLAPYWRWVLATHGPDILYHFGTYRFLLTALVPLHLIRGAG